MSEETRQAAIDVLQLGAEVGERATAVQALGHSFASDVERVSFMAFGAALLAFRPRLPPNPEVYLEAAALLADGWDEGDAVERRVA